MRVPDDIHARVLDLVAEIVNASLAADRRAQWRLYEELKHYCETVAADGRDHPFLWESLADFTADRAQAIGLYRRALAQARRLDAVEYQASILFELAQRHTDLGETVAAYDCASEADMLARRTDDLALRRDISQWLLDFAQTPSPAADSQPIR